MKRPRTLRIAAALVGVALLTGCGDDAQTCDALCVALADADAGDGDTVDTTADAADGTADAVEPSCDAARTPVVFAHGFLAAGDTWAVQVQRFSALGWCPAALVAFDWNSLDRNADHVATLDTTVDAVRAATGSDRIALVGHSAGGGLGYDYLEDAERAAKISHYVHVGSFANEAPAGPDGGVPTLNLWSPDDTVVEGADIDGATNVSVDGADHYEVATSAASFEAMYTFVTGEEDVEASVPAELAPTIEGRALTLGENRAEVGATVRLWEVEADTGRPNGPDPVAVWTIGDDGAWGPATVDPEASYAFEVVPAEEGTVVWYHREPFLASNPLVYLRTLPPPTSLAGALLSAVPLDGADPVVVVFSASRAVIAGRETLRVGDLELATDALADADATAIAFFLYDTDGDQVTSGESVGLFEATPFLVGVDRWVAASAETSTAIVYDDRTVTVPDRAAGTDGVTIVVFD